MAMSAQTLTVKPLLEKAAKDIGVEVSSAKAMKLAVARFLFDAVGATDKEARSEAYKAFCEDCPGWFGTNASAGQAALGLKGKDSTAEFTGDV